MRVAILGAGAIALGSAALLASRNHTPILWSPTNRLRQTHLVATGALDYTGPLTTAASCAEALHGAAAALVALPAYGHAKVLREAAAALGNGQPVLISGHLSLGALYLSRLLHQRGVTAPLAAWGTTVVTGRRESDATVRVNSLRAEVDLAAVPAHDGAAMLALCTELFGSRFRLRESLLAIGLSNVNPQNHLAIALCNFTRIEQAELWRQNSQITPSVGRLMEALDAERLAIAAAFGVDVRTLRRHFHLSFHTPEAPLADMARALAAAGNDPIAPTSVETRYVTEDAPYGLHPTTRLAQIAGVAAPLHESGLHLLSAMYGRNFARENDILNDVLPALDGEPITADRLRRLAEKGWHA